MFDKWWENHPKATHWYNNTRANATNVCPDWLWSFAGVNVGLDSMEHFYSVEKEIGYKTESSIIRKAGHFIEKTKSLRSIGYALCIPAYTTGGLDALYQEYHHDTHIGMAVGDWFMDTASSIHHWYVGAKGSVHNWWEQESHWWK